MNVRTKAIGGAAIIAVVALIFAYPVFAAATASLPNASVATNQSNSPTSTSIVSLPPALTVGQTVTFTSTNGQWRVLSSPVTPLVRTGAASGTVTLTVTGAYKHGYSLSITSGALSINGSTYSIVSGSAEMGPWQARLVGQGSFSTSAPGSFLMAGGAHADFFGSTFNTLRFDVQANGAEYGVVLLVTATHS